MLRTLALSMFAMIVLRSTTALFISLILDLTTFLELISHTETVVDLQLISIDNPVHPTGMEFVLSLWIVRVEILL